MTPKKPSSVITRNIRMNCNRKNANQNQSQNECMAKVMERWIYHHDHAKNVVKCLNHVKYVLGFVLTNAVVAIIAVNSMLDYESKI